MHWHSDVVESDGAETDLDTMMQAEGEDGENSGNEVRLESAGSDKERSRVELKE